MLTLNLMAVWIVVVTVLCCPKAQPQSDNVNNEPHTCIQIWNTMPADNGSINLQRSISAQTQQEVGGVVAFSKSPKGDFLIVSHDNRILKVIDAKTGRQQNAFTLPVREEAVAALCFGTADSSIVYYCTSDGLFRWRWDAKEKPRRLLGKSTSKESKFLSTPVEALVCSPDGQYLACIDWRHQVFLLSLHGEEARGFAKVELIQAATVGPFELKKMAIAFSPDSRFLAYSSGNDVAYYGVIEKKGVKVLAGHSDRVCSLRFSADGKVLASTSHDRTVRLWNIETGKDTRIDGEFDTMIFVAWSSDGKYIGLADSEGKLVVVEYPSLKTIWKTQGPKSGFSGIEFVEGNFAITSGEAPALQVWDVKNRKQIIWNR